MAGQRAQWSSRLGFILAAAGSAVGLGNIWRFPYVTGENGGGWFVLIYLACILVVGLPVMIGEIMIGRSTQKSPVGAIRQLTRPGSPWMGLGFAGIASAFLMLSFYSVVAGWTLHYLSLSAFGTFGDASSNAAANVFVVETFGSTTVNMSWHLVFMFITVFIVIGGIQQGIELGTKLMMPLLLIMMSTLLVVAVVTDFEDGFMPAVEFAFSFDNSPSWNSVLAALGQAFFTLSIGMGAMITYGSYLREDDDVVGTAAIVSGLDTLIALLACLVIFPFLFSNDLDANQGPGLVFIVLPLALTELPGGAIWCLVFFGLLFFAAVTSSISLLEVVVSYFVDEWKWKRWMATVLCGSLIALVGIPSALSGGQGLFGDEMVEATSSVFAVVNDDGKNWMDTVDHIVSNIMLPMGGLCIALFVSWVVAGKMRKTEFMRGTKFGVLYYPWLITLRFVVPIAVLAVFLNVIGVIGIITELIEN